MIESKRFTGIEISLIRQVINQALPGAINLALGELGYPLQESLQTQAHKLLDSGTAVYTPNAGLPELREAIASYYADGKSAEQICVTNGAEEAVFLSLLALSNPGDTIAIPDPDYTAYPAIAKILGCSVLRLPYQDDLSSIDWAHWDSLLMASKASILVLSNPQNPSGKSFNKDELTNLSTICNKYNITLVADEIYRELYHGEPTPNFGAEFEQLVRISGLSKSHCMSGWRLGWVNAPASISRAVIKAKQYVSTCAHWLSQQLAVYALSENGLQAQSEIRKHLQDDMAMVVKSLSGIGTGIIVKAPQAGPYIMIKTPLDDLELASRLAQEGLIVVPGSAFGEVSRGWIRLSIALPSSTLKQGLDILKSSLIKITGGN